MNNHKSSKKFVVGEVIKNIKQNKLYFIKDKHKLEDVSDSSSIFVIINLNTMNESYITYEKLYNEHTCMKYAAQQTSEYKSYTKKLYIEDDKVKSFYKCVENKFLNDSKYDNMYHTVYRWYKQKGLIK